VRSGVVVGQEQSFLIGRSQSAPDSQGMRRVDRRTRRQDHKHVGGREFDYRFTDIDTLVGDFLRDVEKLA
jgi:hypothetical protein